MALAVKPQDVGTSYEQLAERLNGKDIREVTKTTRIVRLTESSIAYQYHETNVAVLTSTGDITLNSGGYYTVSTKQRINDILPHGLTLLQEKREWFLLVRDLKQGHSHRFYDGMTFNIHTWELLPATFKVEEALAERDAENNVISKLIEVYLKGLNEYQLALVLKAAEDEFIPVGDCIQCRLEVCADVDDARAQVYEPSHIKTHLEEKYYFATLFYNAYHSQGYPNPYLVLMLDKRDLSRVRHQLRRFFQKQLLKGVMVR